MTRAEGFAFADVAVHYLDDPKIRRLVRSTRDESVVARAIVAHLSAVLASWEHGQATTIEDAAPLWLTGVEDLVERLDAVGLVTADGRIPDEARESYFGPARDRRQERRDAGRRGGKAKARNAAADPGDAGSALAPPAAPPSAALPDPIRSAPSRTDPTGSVPSGRPRTRGAESVRDILPRLSLVDDPSSTRRPPA